MKIFRATNWDDIFEGLRELHLAHWKELGRSLEEFNPQYEHYKQLFEAGRYFVFCAEVEGRLVGHLSGYRTFSMHTGAPIAVEDAFYVLPEHRGHIGRALLKEAIDFSKACGIKGIQATTRPATRSASLLRKFGFEFESECYILRL